MNTNRARKFRNTRRKKVKFHGNRYTKVNNLLEREDERGPISETKEHINSTISSDSNTNTISQELSQPDIAASMLQPPKSISYSKVKLVSMSSVDDSVNLNDDKEGHKV